MVHAISSLLKTILYMVLQLYTPQSILHENRAAAVTSQVFAECRRAASCSSRGARVQRETIYPHSRIWVNWCHSCLPWCRDGVETTDFRATPLKSGFNTVRVWRSKLILRCWCHFPFILNLQRIFRWSGDHPSNTGEWQTPHHRPAKTYFQLFLATPIDRNARQCSGAPRHPAWSSTGWHFYQSELFGTV